MVNKHLGMRLPEDSISQICLILFIVGIKIENTLEERYTYGINLVIKDFSKQIKT